MPKQSKAELDEQEELAEAQADLEDQIEAELAMWDAGVPDLSSFGLPDDWAYVGPSLTQKNEQDMSCSKEDWKAFLKKVEEDLSDD